MYRAVWAVDETMESTVKGEWFNTRHGALSVGWTRPHFLMVEDHLGNVWYND